MSLSSLPKYIGITIFIEWISFYELVYFDVALCNRRLRKYIFDYLTSDAALIQCRHLTNNCASAQWIFSRKLNVDALKIDELDLNCLFVEKESEHETISTKYNDMLEIFRNGIFLPRLLALDLSHNYALLPETLMKITAKCIHLQSINLELCDRINDVAVAAMSASCPSLDSISLASCHAIGDAGIDTLTANCPQLTALNLFDCHQLTDKTVDSIIANCTHLLKLNLALVGDQATGQPDNVNQNISGPAFYTLFRSKFISALTHLNVACRTVIWSESIQCLADHCEQLIEVNLSGLKLDADCLWCLIRNNNNNLTRISITAVHWWEEHQQACVTGVLQSISAFCNQNLQCLELSGCNLSVDSASFAMLFRRCKLISSLNISDCGGVDATMLTCIQDYCTNLTSLVAVNFQVGCWPLEYTFTVLTTLKVLHLAPKKQRINVIFPPPMNTENSTNNNSNQQQQQLKELVLSPRAIDTIDILFHIVQQFKLTLTTLHIPQCMELNDGILHTTRKKCTRITSLDISKSRLLTANGLLRALTVNKHRLRWLSLADNRAATSDVVIAVCAAQSRLTSLNLSGLCGDKSPFSVIKSLFWFSKSMHRDMLSAVAYSCRSLTFLDVHNTENIVSDSGIAALALHCTRLREVNMEGSGMNYKQIDYMRDNSAVFKGFTRNVTAF